MLQCRMTTQLSQADQGDLADDTDIDIDPARTLGRRLGVEVRAGGIELRAIRIGLARHLGQPRNARLRT